MSHISFLALTAATLIATAGTPVLAQSRHQAPAQPAAKNQPAKTHKAASSGAKHQAICRGRYKSYDVKSDSYLYRGKKVRCTL